MQSINDWFLETIRADEKRGIMSGWLEEKRYLLLHPMAHTIEHLINGGSLIVLTDSRRAWFGDYITTHINQPHNGRPFFPIMQIKHLHCLIDSSSTEGGMQGFKLIYSMLDMMSADYRFWYIGTKNARSSFATSHDKDGWHWILDDEHFLSSTDEKLDYKLLSLFKLFDRAILAAMLNQISLDRD